MTKKIAVLAAVPVLCAATPPAKIGNGDFFAIGVVTADVEKTAKEYQRILGVVPEDFGISNVTDPQGKPISLKMRVVFLKNIYIKLHEPITENGTYAAHLREHGMSIQNMQMRVHGLADIRSEMERNGGKWVQGAADDMWAYVDFREKLGIVLEPMDLDPPARPVTIAPGDSATLGAEPVTRVGFVVGDARKSARNFAQVFGIPVPKVRKVDGGHAPSGGVGAPLRVASWQQGGKLGIDLVESTDDQSPWSRYRAFRKGDAAQYITFDVGNRLEETLVELQAKGGKWVHGLPKDGFALLDFMDSLGLYIKIFGTSTKQ